jgi:rhamnosyltransferase subunit B
LMDKTGPKTLITEILLPQVREMFDDLMQAVKDADLLVSGELIYAARSVVEKTGIRWATFNIIPLGLMSAYDPPVFPMAIWLERFSFMPPIFFKILYRYMRRRGTDWTGPYRKFRRDIGLDENHDLLYRGRHSGQLHLALYSRTIAPKQKDWPAASLQSGFCFYDGQNDAETMPDGLDEFLDAGEPPIIFTLGSMAILSPGKFFEDSIAAVKKLKKRAVVLYGAQNEPPPGLDENIAGFGYAPHSRIFSRASCVVHQGGVSTISHILRAGVPMLVVPDVTYDQPDNAARCRKLGVARVLYREHYNAESATRELNELLSKPSYRARSVEAKKIVEEENGLQTACDALESLLQK